MKLNYKNMFVEAFIEASELLMKDYIGKIGDVILRVYEKDGWGVGAYNENGVEILNETVPVDENLSGYEARENLRKNIPKTIRDMRERLEKRGIKVIALDDSEFYASL